MTPQERADKIVRDMMIFPDQQERFYHVISVGRRAPGLEPDWKQDAFRIEGCQSALWLVPEYREGKCYYRCDSDALITRGVASILCQVYSDARPEEVLALNGDFLKEAGITEHLTPNRSNGLSQVLKTIREFAARQASSSST